VGILVVGTSVGEGVVGIAVGAPVIGARVGALVGGNVGSDVFVGAFVGAFVVGDPVGVFVGGWLGASVGASVGAFVGANVGDALPTLTYEVYFMLFAQLEGISLLRVKHHLLVPHEIDLHSGVSSHNCLHCDSDSLYVSLILGLSHCLPVLNTSYCPGRRVGVWVGVPVGAIVGAGVGGKSLAYTT